MANSFFEHGMGSSLMCSFMKADGESAYARFAKETYNRVYDDMKEALEKSDGKPILIVSGEAYRDVDFDLKANKLLPDSLENPAFAATVTHLAIMRAAMDLVDKEDLVVSQELTDHAVEVITDTIKERDESEGIYSFEVPSRNGLRYALENGLKVSPDDPLGGYGRRYPERSMAAIEAIQKHALAENPPKIVFRMGSVGNTGTLQGIPLQKLLDEGKELTRDPDDDPFKDQYAQTLFYNTVQNTPFYLLEYSDEDVDYAKNSANAEQIDPPGAISQAEKLLIPDYIKMASIDKWAQDFAKEMEACSAQQERLAAPTADALLKP